MPKEVVESLVEGGKATAGPPLGPALGPMGINIGQVIADINKKTVDFKGMQVPVKVVVDRATKTYEITVGTPPASALIKKEARVQKGSGSPKDTKVADLRVEQIIKIAKMKEDSLLGKDLKQKIKEIIGTCRSMGVLVHGVEPAEAIRQVNEGKFDTEIREEKTELSVEELRQLEEERQRLEEEMKEKREEFLRKAKAIAEEFKDKEPREIQKKLIEAGIPDKIIHEVVKIEEKKPEDKGKAEEKKKEEKKA